MNSFEIIETYILNKKGAVKEFPFDNVTAVYKIMNKMFALMGMDNNPVRINLKSDPMDALALRDSFKSIIPGYHMNKKHWNTIIVDESIPDEILFNLIDVSYNLVVNKLKKSDRELLNS